MLGNQTCYLQSKFSYDNFVAECYELSIRQEILRRVHGSRYVEAISDRHRV
jgi:hypothetical protein